VGNNQLGLVPMGKPIDFQQTADVSRNIVNGLVDGLEYLHKLNIIHRDIRPSNLILDQDNNVVIIDCETSVMHGNTYETYYGGCICWPKRLLETDRRLYTPEPADDLFACILVVLHLLFPSRFDAFHVNRIGISSFGQQRNEETEQLLELWNDIGQSQIWGRFMTAAQGRKYKELKGMADVFCHI
jgi:serine/threonine protein kinase